MEDEFTLKANDMTVKAKKYYKLAVEKITDMVSLLPDDIRPGPDFYGLPWEAVIFTIFLGFCILFLFTWRCIKSIKSRIYARKEKIMGQKVALLINEKRELLLTYSELKQKLKTTETRISSKTAEKGSLEETAQQLKQSNAQMKQNIVRLREEQDDQDNTILNIEIEINTDLLQNLLAAEGKRGMGLLESKAHLVQKAEGLGERHHELEVEVKMCKRSNSDEETIASTNNAAKEDLQESIKQLKVLMLKSESAQQKLQQKLEIMREMNLENEQKLHRMLMVKERERLQAEEKLDKAVKQITFAAITANIYRQIAKEVHEEFERTTQDFQNQIVIHEQEAHNNWVAARKANEDLAEANRENAYLCQRLTDTQFKLDMLEKYLSLQESRPMFRGERSQYGPSPLNRPSSETQAFLSPPTLVDCPPRLSPQFVMGRMPPPMDPLDFPHWNPYGPLEFFPPRGGPPIGSHSISAAVRDQTEWRAPWGQGIQTLRKLQRQSHEELQRRGQQELWELLRWGLQERELQRLEYLEQRGELQRPRAPGLRRELQ